jgi:formate-dependent nitrite reductase membrane component NrfD
MNLWPTDQSLNLFVADPGWRWWIILYFYLGGIAAGAYFSATLIDLVGGKENREVARIGYWLAFPLVVLCGLFLTVDLDQPLRFWHMLFKSELVHQALDEGWPWTGSSWALMAQAPVFKYWSPMSVGSWALLLFGVCSFLSFLGSLWPEGRLAWLLRFSLLGRLVELVGCAVGFFVASYTGALLTATNQPVWSDTNWVAALFLASAWSTGLSAILLLSRLRDSVPGAGMHHLERAERWALVLEVVVFAFFLVSLGSLLGPLLATWQGIVLVAGTAVLGILVPLALHLRSRTVAAASVLALLGGFLLRYGLLTAPPEMLAHGPGQAGGKETVKTASSAKEPTFQLLPHFSPEADRKPGQLGADPDNRPDPNEPAKVQPRSKVFGQE